MYDEHHQVYGPRKVWKQLRREGFCVARCTVGRLMRARPGRRGAWARVDHDHARGQWRPDYDDFDHPATATRIAMRSLARRILELNNEVADLDDLIEPLVTDLGARLIERPCIGIETAGQLLVTAGDNPGRIRSEAAWAMLCGVAPLPASSGKTDRHWA